MTIRSSRQKTKIAFVGARTLAQSGTGVRTPEEERPGGSLRRHFRRMCAHDWRHAPQLDP